MKHILFTFLAAVLALSFLPAVTAVEIMQNIDRNMLGSTTKSTTRMIISTKRATRTMTSINYSKGKDMSYTEYIAPAKEKGTKMLKIKDNLWLYDPGTDREIQISGNMLRQSVMGSDLSYEDFMDETELETKYNAVLGKDIVYDSRNCFVLTMTAKQANLAYSKRVVYVDKERMVPLYEELYAKSGKLLKTLKMNNVTQIGKRWYPMNMVFKDALKDGNGTEFIVDKIEFDISIPDYYFSKAVLKK